MVPGADGEPAKLIISKLEKQDTGLYTCSPRIDNSCAGPENGYHLQVRCENYTFTYK